MTQSPTAMILSAAGWAMCGGLLVQLTSFILFIVLARLLTPHDFGVMALATAALELLLLVARAGLPETLIQRDNPTESEKSTAFWLSVLFGITGSVTLIALAPAISSLYHLPEIKPICQLLAIACFTHSLGIIHEGLLRRTLGYKALTVRIGITSILASSICILLAYYGFGLYALLLQRLSSSFALTILAIWALPWRPQLRFDWHVARALLSSGAPLSTAATIGHATPKTLEALIAYTLDATTLGYFRIAWRTIDMISASTSAPLAAITLPVIARLRNTPSQAAQRSAGLITMLGYITAPIILTLPFTSFDLIPTVFGPHWTPSATILTILTPLCFLSALPTMSEGIFTALAARRALLSLAGLQLSLTILLTLCAAPFGLAAIAWAQVTRVTLVTTYALFCVNRHFPLWTALRKQTFRPLVLASSFTLITSAILYQSRASLPLIVLATLPPLTYAAVVGYFAPTLKESIIIRDASQ